VTPLDLALLIAGIAAEAVVCGILVQRRIFRRFPIFSLYVFWAVFNDSAMMLISREFPARYLQAFLVELPLDSLLQFCVLVELAWAVLRPLRASLSRWAILIPIAILLVAAALMWPVGGTLARPGVSVQWHLLFQLQQTFSILRILFFLGLAALSQILAIGWRDRELQIVTGLGLYSLVSLGAAAMHSHSESLNLYRAVNQIVMASYFCSLVYWAFSFVQKEAPRQEFSPRMQSILLAVAGAARANRLAVEDMPKGKS
jgi:hypothetical protein